MLLHSQHTLFLHVGVLTVKKKKTSRSYQYFDLPGSWKHLIIHNVFTAAEDLEMIIFSQNIEFVKGSKKKANR